MPTFEKTGSIPFDPKIDSTELLSHFGKCSQGIRANDLCVSGNQLTFGGGACRFVTTLDPLYYFASGDLTVDPSAPSSATASTISNLCNSRP